VLGPVDAVDRPDLRVIGPEDAHEAIVMVLGEVPRNTGAGASDHSDESSRAFIDGFFGTAASVSSLAHPPPSPSPPAWVNQIEAVSLASSGPPDATPPQTEPTGHWAAPDAVGSSLPLMAPPPPPLDMAAFFDPYDEMEIGSLALPPPPSNWAGGPDESDATLPPPPVGWAGGPDESDATLPPPPVGWANSPDESDTTLPPPPVGWANSPDESDTTLPPPPVGWAGGPDHAYAALPPPPVGWIDDASGSMPLPPPPAEWATYAQGAQTSDLVGSTGYGREEVPDGDTTTSALLPPPPDSYTSAMVDEILAIEPEEGAEPAAPPPPEAPLAEDVTIVARGARRRIRLR